MPFTPREIQGFDAAALHLIRAVEQSVRWDPLVHEPGDNFVPTYGLGYALIALNAERRWVVPERDIRRDFPLSGVNVPTQAQFEVLRQIADQRNLGTAAGNQQARELIAGLRNGPKEGLHNSGLIRLAR